MPLKPRLRVLNFQLYLQEFETVITEHLKNRKIWEPAESATAGRYIKHGDVAVDIGAHIGYYTMLFSHLVGPEGRVIAFEPDPLNYNYLNSNVALNKKTNVIMNQLAVSNTDSGPVKLYQTGAITGHHSLAKVFETTSEIDVPVISLDLYFGPGDRVDFVKIDTEGNEVDILLGMERVVRDNPQIKLMLEFNADNLKAFNRTQKDMYEVLRLYGFTVYAIDIKTTKLMQIKQEDLDWFIEQKEVALAYRNIFAIKE